MTKVIRRQTSPFNWHPLTDTTIIFISQFILQITYNPAHPKKNWIPVYTKNKKKIKSKQNYAQFFQDVRCLAN